MITRYRNGSCIIPSNGLWAGKYRKPKWANHHGQLGNWNSMEKCIFCPPTSILNGVLMTILFITNCRECHANKAACHWMRAPQLYRVSCCFLTFWYLHSAFWHVLDCWLAERHNSHSSLSHILIAHIQLVMSDNLLCCCWLPSWRCPVPLMRLVSRLEVNFPLAVTPIGLEGWKLNFTAASQNF